MTGNSDIETALRGANPVPDPEWIVSDAELDTLFASLRREAMTQRTLERQEQAPRRARPRARRVAVLVGAALLVLLAVPAAAWLLDTDAPPLFGEYPSGSGEMTVWDADDGIGEDCAWKLDFDAAGVPLMAGECGVLRLVDGEWARLAPAQDSCLTDIAVAPDGTVWVGSCDHPVKSVHDGAVVTHDVTATSLAVTADGTVWATRYVQSDTGDERYALLSFDGTAWTDHGVGPVHELIVAPDGVLWTIDWETPAIGTITDGVYDATPVPEGFAGDHATIAPDGSLWTIGGSETVVEDRGIGHVLIEAVRYDGEEWTTIAMPFPEPIDIAVHPNGTVWVGSQVYGVFAYDGEEWVRYGTAEGLPSEMVNFVEIGPDGSVYVGTSMGVARITAD